MKLKIESTMHSQRLALGIICGLLPIGCVLFGLLGKSNYPNWWYSISATFYANSNVWMIISLGLASWYFLTYKGHDLGDKWLTNISSLSAINIVLFPCNSRYVEYAGMFQIPVKISAKIHNVSAACLFISFAVIILFKFTKTNNIKRKIVYIICGLGIVFFMGLQVYAVRNRWPGYWTLINEFFMLEFFAIAWIIKSKAIRITDE